MIDGIGLIGLVGGATVVDILCCSINHNWGRVNIRVINYYVNGIGLIGLVGGATVVDILCCSINHNWGRVNMVNK